MSERISSQQRTSDFTLGIIVPCFNEEDVFPYLSSELQRFCDTAKYAVKILIIDDGSTDATWRMITELCEKDARFSSLRFSRNFGHQTAVSAGLFHIEGDVVAVIDGDLQDPPEEIDNMLELWKQGYDVVYGVRKNRKEGLLLRSAYAVFYRMLKKIANIDIPLDAGDFSLMDRKVVDKINAMPEHNRFVRGLRGWVGFSQIGHSYERQSRKAGEPKYTFRKLVKLALDGIITFSILPLRLAVWMGTFAALFGFMYLIWAVFNALVHGDVPSGWASLTVMIIFFGGIQLLVLGIIGEYIGRIFEETKNRPHYVISDTAGWLKS